MLAVYAMGLCINPCRCACGNCEIMPTAHECVCCCEIDEVVQKKEESDTQLTCITDHEGFEPVCLNLYVLQTAYFSYRQQYAIWWNARPDT